MYTFLFGAGATGEHFWDAGPFLYLPMGSGILSVLWGLYVQFFVPDVKKGYQAIEAEITGFLKEGYHDYKNSIAILTYEIHGAKETIQIKDFANKGEIGDKLTLYYKLTNPKELTFSIHKKSGEYIAAYLFGLGLILISIILIFVFELK